MPTFVRLRSQSTGQWFVHPDLRTRLVADAERLGTNLTDVAVKILADRHKVPFSANGRKTTPAADQDVLNLGDSIPRTLERKIRNAAISSGMATWIDEIRRELCDHYGLPVPVKVPGKRNRSARARA